MSNSILDRALLLAVAPVAVWIGLSGSAEAGAAVRGDDPAMSSFPRSAGGLISSAGVAGARGLGALPPPRRAAASSAYGRLPLSFEHNRGQSDRRVKFISRGAGYALALTDTGPLLSLTGRRGRPGHRSAALLRMGFVGGRTRPPLKASGRLPGRVNYLVGSDSRRWQRDVRTYKRVSYGDVWPGIDVTFHGNQRQLEYDFELAPGADPGRIMLRFSGARRLRLNEQGDLVIAVPGGSVRDLAPRAYQEIAGRRRTVASRYVLLPDRRVGVRVGAYDRRRPLVIDPVISYSTYVGGLSEDDAYGIAVDASGSAYIGGVTNSPNFPTTAGALQPTYGLGTFDAFVAKLNPAGTAFSYATYLGGSGADAAGLYGLGIAVDAAGSAYVTSMTDSADFPITSGAARPTYGGGTGDAFVAKLNPTGTALMYSTYLGGTGFDRGRGIAVDAAGSAFVGGDTQADGAASPQFPTTANAAQPTYGGGNRDAFLARLNPAGSALTYGTYLGGSLGDTASSVALDANGNGYATGWTLSTNFPATPGAFQTANRGGGGEDVFVARFDPNGSKTYSTYLGSTSGDTAFGIAADANGGAYVTGQAGAANFPVTAGAAQNTYGGGGGDGFVTKLMPDGSGLTYSTFLGGAGEDVGYAIAIDPSQSVYVTGTTNSTNFPVTADATQAPYGGYRDSFLTKFTPAGSALAYSTHLGGLVDESGKGVALDPQGHAYVGGFTNSPNFPTTAGAAQESPGGHYDAFVTKYSQSSTTTQPPPAGGTTTQPPPAAGTAPGTGGAQSVVPPSRSSGPGIAAQALRARAFRSCLARAARHTRLDRTLTRRGTLRQRVLARRHLRRHAAHMRRRCLKRYGRTPGLVTGLSARARSSARIELSFRAPGSDGTRPPPAHSYLVKQSPRPITDRRSFGRAQTLCAGRCRLAPTRVGELLRLLVTDLRPNTTYYYAVAARDNVSRRLGPRSRAVRARTR